jgi:glycine cleavage system H protein
LKPEDWAAAKAALVGGGDVGAKYEAKMEADGFAGCV